MAVKRSASAARMLEVFSTLAHTQPSGVSALARAVAADKSAVQRDLMTLADAGWIRPAPGNRGQWETSPHVVGLARPPASLEALRRQAQPQLDRLRVATGETAYLAVPDGTGFIVLAAAESIHPLRLAPAVGLPIPFAGSATGKVLLPFLSAVRQAERLAGMPDAAARKAVEDEMRLTRVRGYAVNDEEVHPGSVAIASVVLDEDNRPVAALVVSGPAERLVADRREKIGRLVAEAAAALRP